MGSVRDNCWPIRDMMKCGWTPVFVPWLFEEVTDNVSKGRQSWKFVNGLGIKIKI